MKTIHNTHRNLTIILVILFLMPIAGWSQPKRINPPKRTSKITSVDQFVKKSFSLYHKVFVYDSLTQIGAEIPIEVEEALVERIEQDLDSLWQIFPTVFDDMSSGKGRILTKAKAAVNLNKSKKALKYCMKTAKAYVLGSEEDEDQS